MDWMKLLAKVLKLRFDRSPLQGSKGKLRVTDFKSYSLDFLEAFARLGCYDGLPPPPGPESLTPQTKTPSHMQLLNFELS